METQQKENKINVCNTFLKIIKNIIDTIHLLDDHKYTERVTRGHDQKLITRKSLCNTHLNSFFPPPSKCGILYIKEAVNADNINSFKHIIQDSTLLDKHVDTTNIFLNP